MKRTLEIKKEGVLILPTSKPLSQTQLVQEIKKAEEGPFISVQEGMKNFEQWLEKRENK